MFRIRRLHVYPRHSVNLSKEICATISDLLRRGEILNGSYIAEFEKKFADYIGAKYAFGTSSGRMGLLLALSALRLKLGDEIIVSDYTLHSIPQLIKSYGLRPIFVDIDPDTYNIDISLIKRNITSKTKAILATHLFGQPCQIDGIMRLAKEYGLRVIEDCAQSCGAEFFGRKIGTFGDISFFSFNVGKNLNCCGGGMVVTNDEALWDRLSELRNRCISQRYGRVLSKVMGAIVVSFATSKTFFPFTLYPLLRITKACNLGFLDHLTDEHIRPDTGLMPNFGMRLANLQAAIGLLQLESLDSRNEKTRTNGELLTCELKDIKWIKVPLIIPGAKPIFLYYKIEAPDRERLRRRLLQLGIDTKSDDMSACSGLSIFKDFARPCPNARGANLRSFEIPNAPYLEAGDILYIANKIRRAIKEP